MDALSPKQTEVYEVICDFIKENYYPPTVRELAAALGLSSTSTVDWYLKILERKGWIMRESTPRSIRPMTMIEPEFEA